MAASELITIKTNLHLAADTGRDFSLYMHNYSHLPHTHAYTHTCTHSRRCACRRIRYRSACVYRYFTTRSVLTQFSRSTRGVEGALLANRWDDQYPGSGQYRGDDWSTSHPTMSSDRLTQLTGTYRHTDTAGHVIKFMAIF